MHTQNTMSGIFRATDPEVVSDAQIGLFSAFRRLGLEDLPARVEDVPAWLAASADLQGSVFGGLWRSLSGDAAGVDDLLVLVGRAVADLGSLVLH